MMTPPPRIRLAWAPVPAGAARRDVAWDLLRGLVAPGAQLSNPCPRCGGSHGPVRTTDASTRPAIAYAGSLAVVAVADAGPGRFAIDAEPRADAVRDAAGLDGVLGRRAPVGILDWVRVEAALKADGRGLRIDPADVSVTPRGSSWRAVFPDGGEVEVWDLEGPPGVVVSAAISAAAEEAPAGPAMP